jgi:glyoxylase-like metal-dependent hydrolase (beta-lactamase superfamily II)
MKRAGMFLASLCLAWSTGQAAWADGRVPDCTGLTPVPWRAVAPGVWAWVPAQPSESALENLGHVLSTVVIVQDGKALVIDPGPHYGHGWRVRASLYCQFSARPIGVVNTHAHSKNVLANAAFADLQAHGQLAIMASAGTGEAMLKRCPQCLQSLVQTLGDAVMQRTHIVLPDRVLTDGEILMLGPMKVQVLVVSHAHTESDLMLWLPAHRVLLAGGLVYGGRLPELAQGSAKGWLSALQRMAALRPLSVVSDQVSIAPNQQALPPAIDATQRYLLTLRQRLAQAMEAGLHGSETQTITWPEYTDWADFEGRQEFNVQRVWRELESEWMAAPLPAPSTVLD